MHLHPQLTILIGRMSHAPGLQFPLDFLLPCLQAWKILGQPEDHVDSRIVQLVDVPGPHDGAPHRCIDLSGQEDILEGLPGCALAHR